MLATPIARAMTDENIMIFFIVDLLKDVYVAYSFPTQGWKCLTYDIAMVVPNRHGELDFRIGWISKGIQGNLQGLRCSKIKYTEGVCPNIIKNDCRRLSYASA